MTFIYGAQISGYMFVGTDGDKAEMPMIWIFPYFFEPRIIECLPSLIMLDYQVP